jgi:hypothetical protein
VCCIGLEDREILGGRVCDWIGAVLVVVVVIVIAESIAIWSATTICS